MKYVALAVGVAFGGILLLTLGFISVTAGYHALVCRDMSGQYHKIATQWSPVQGCTIDVLGTRIKVAP